MEKEEKVVSQPLVDRCPECGSPNLIRDYDSGETICSNCGLVIRERIVDKGPDWRVFTPEERESRPRVGAPPNFTIHDKGLSTDIGGPFGMGYDYYGKKLPLETRLQMWRLRKWQIHSRMHSSIDRNLARAMGELDRISDKLPTLPMPVKEKAAVIYRKALEKGIVRGRTITGVIAAALYAACRIMGTPRSLKEISGGDKEYENEIARNYRLLLRELDLQIPIDDPVSWVSKIAEMTGISGQTQGLAIRILLQAKEKRITGGKDPMGLAAAALYIACLQNNEKKVQKRLAEAAGVTEVTVRNRYKKLEQELGLELPNQEQRRKNTSTQERKIRSLFFVSC